MTLDKLHYVNLSTKGTFRPEGVHSTTAQDVEAIFAQVAKEQASHLVLHFHGGLVDEAAGLQSAGELMAHFNDQPGAYPVFFVWESGWLETARRNLSTISQEPFFKKVTEVVLNFVVSKLTQSEDGRGTRLELQPEAEIRAEMAAPEAFEHYDDPAQRATLEDVTEKQEEQFRETLADDDDFVDAVRGIARSTDDGRGVVTGVGTPTLMSQDVLDKLKVDMEEGRGLISASVLIKLAASVLGRVVKRMLKRTDHGVYCTTVEEILREFYLDSVGSWIWRGMKTAIESSFASNDGLSGDALHGGTYFLSQLRTYLSDPSHPPLRVSLVGHSAGGIYICQAVAKAAELMPAGFKFHRVVMLAPGCDFDLFKSSIVDHADRVEAFRMFTMRDEAEAKDAMVPVVYPRSLLYFVSGVLEKDAPLPIVGLQRCHSGGAPYDAAALLVVRGYLTQPGDARVVWGPVEANAGPGLLTAALGHGLFNEALTWKSVIYMLTH
jgi:hypothetical protein